MTTVFLAVLSTLCLSVTGRPGPGKKPTTCETPGIVLEGAPAEITCDFHDDLKTNDSFLVYRRTTGPGVIIAVCEWTGGQPNCRLTGDFVLKPASTGGRVTFKVPSAQQKHSGDYICKTKPADKANATNCTLTVQRNDIMGDHPVACDISSPVTLGEKASFFCMYPRSIGITGVTLEKYNSDKGNELEAVVRCDKGQRTTLHGAQGRIWSGPQDRLLPDSYLKVSIPQTTAANAGTYLCKSAAVGKISENCMLKLTNGEKSRQTSDTEQIHLLRAILACVVILTVLFVGFAAYVIWPKRFRGKENEGRSAQALLQGEPQ